MIGSIIGDIIGSRFEFNNIHTKNFKLFTKQNDFTDDTICTIAIADALLSGRDYKTSLLNWCRRYPHPMGSYGGSFNKWILSVNPQPYNSFGNGALMRVSPVAFFFDDLETIQREAKKTAAVSHNHPEALKAVTALCTVIYYLRNKDLASAMKVMEEYDPDFKEAYKNAGIFDETCQGTLPACFYIFTHSNDFEDCMRNAMAFGGDSDTIGAIVGGMAEAYWYAPGNLVISAWKILPPEMFDVITEFYTATKSHEYRHNK